MLVVLVIAAVSLFASAAAAKPRRYWCARAATLQQQIADTAAFREAQPNGPGQAAPAPPAIVFPLYHLTLEDQYNYAQARCTKGR